MKIGFACHILKNETESIEYGKPKTTTVKFIVNNPDKAGDKLQACVDHNVKYIDIALKYLSKLPENRRMFRLGSEILPLFTHPASQFFYTDKFLNYFRDQISYVKNYADKYNIRLSFHPGQFCCLASDKPEVITNSIKEFEYHTMIAEAMGYGQHFQDFKINVHCSGRGGPEKFIETFGKLSRAAKNMITVENDEFGYGLDEIIPIGEHCPIVFDIHHHFVREGVLRPSQNQIEKISQSWEDLHEVKPVMHYSLPRVCEKTNNDCLLRVAKAYKKQKLRAHSDYMYHTDQNRVCLKVAEELNADIMVEAKMKNLAVDKLGV